MAIFKRKKEEDYEEDLEQMEVRDLKPEHKKRRKELPKPWGKKERYTVLVFLLATVLISGVLAASSRNWKLPGFPQVKLKVPSFKNFNFDFLSGKTITIGNKVNQANQVNQGKKRKILKAFDEKIRNLSGTYALFVVDLESGYSFGENESEVLTAASLIKLPVIATLYMESEKGNLNLDDKPDGSGLTYRQLAGEMGLKSNNQAQLVVANALGRDKIQAVARDLGMKDTSYSENETTAYEIGLFFQKLWKNEIVSQKLRDEILGYLTNTIYEDWLPAGIPDEIRVAHKYGRGLHVVSDGGIVFTEHPFVLVVMTQGVIEKEADIVIPEISRIVYTEMAL